MADEKMLNEKEIRSYLGTFCDAVGKEVRPTPLDEVHLLIEFMSLDAEFMEIRRKIASTNLEIIRAQRVGSSTKSSLPSLQASLLQLESERQRIITVSAKSKKFYSYRENQTREARTRLEEWKEVQSLAERARSILERTRIPSIVRPEKMYIPSVIEAVENHVEAAPPPGSLVLMGEEPKPNSLHFHPASIYASGLNPRIFGGSVKLLVSMHSERGLNAEAQGATVFRSDLVMRLDEKRFPLQKEHWDQFDDILPFMARKIITPILPECVPFSSPYSNLRNLLSIESWRAIRNSANDRNNGTCVICGSPAGGEVHAEWSYIEPFRDSGAFGIQKLIDVRPYCSLCSKVIFPDPSKLVIPAPVIEGYKRSSSAFIVNPALKRLSRINRWEEDENPDPLAVNIAKVQEAYSRRSQVRWALDLSLLHGLNVSLNPDMVMHRKGWIMKKSDVHLFDNDKSVHLTRIFGAAFINSDGRRIFFEVPPIHLVPWDTSANDIWQNPKAPSSLKDTPVDIHVENEIETEEDLAGPENPDEIDFITQDEEIPW